MLYLDLTLASPADNLACDESLLDFCEQSGSMEVLRFWESPTYCLVAGYSTPLVREIDLHAAQLHQVPILRRYSGGGTVLQGRGCLSYALILAMHTHPELRSISSTNRFILQRNRDALQPLVDDPIRVDGISDLTSNDLKFSGNAQRRKSTHILMHGTILYRLDLSLMAALLHHPVREPGYRRGRTHDQFVANIPVSDEKIKAALATAWSATDPLSVIPHTHIRELAATRYNNPRWITRL